MSDLQIRSTYSVSLGGGQQGHDISRSVSLASNVMASNVNVNLPASAAAATPLWTSASNTGAGAPTADFAYGVILIDPSALLTVVRNVTVRIYGKISTGAAAVELAQFKLNRNTGPFGFGLEMNQTADNPWVTTTYYITAIDATNITTDIVQCRLQLYL